MTYFFVQQKSTPPICALILSLLIANEAAHARTTLYGIDKISHMSHHAPGPFYVQLGAFSTLSHAVKYKRHLQTRGKYPITIKSHGVMHAVVVGPLTSVSALNAFALSQQAMPKTPAKHLNVPKTIKPQHANTPPVLINTPLQTVPKQTMPNVGFLQSHGYIQGDIGFSAVHATGSITINNGAVDPYPANVDVYSTQHHTQGGMASLMAGLRFQNETTYLPAYAFALRYQNLFDQSIAGTITQYSDPAFKNYNYTWNVQSNVLSIFSKLNLMQYKRVLPYVDIGLGYAMNRSGNYQETALPGVTARIDSPNFQSRTSNQFSYDLGAGLDYQLNQNILLSIGYEFQDLGTMRSGNGQPPWSKGQLTLNHYQTNTVLLSVSYLLGVQTNQPVNHQ